MTDGTGAIRYRGDYDPYGRPNHVQGDLTPDFGYAGMYYHAPSGLNLTLYRAYDSDFGRWLSRDPIQEAGGLNLYGYVANNPINETDIHGLWPSGIPVSKLGIYITPINVHGNSINRVLNYLTPQDISTLTTVQQMADLDQSAASAFTHAMRDGTTGQTAAEAQELANYNVKNLIYNAQQAECNGKHAKALEYLGRAMHTLQDSTSPMHNGFQPWDGNPNDLAAAKHGNGEDFDPGVGSQLDQATKDAYDYFTGAKAIPNNFFIYHADKRP